LEQSVGQYKDGRRGFGKISGLGRSTLPQIARAELFIIGGSWLLSYLGLIKKKIERLLRI
jgi:hypothetical protein